MAIVKGILKISGSVEGFTFYTRRGSDKVIMRTKGGVKKNIIATSPKFANSRKQQQEFAGCAKFGSLSRFAFGGLHRLADYNLTPVLIGIGRNLMKLDSISDKGQRNLLLSNNKMVFDRFNFNRNYPLNTVLRISPHWEIDREHIRAEVTFPGINSDIDLLNIQKLPFFRLIIAIGAISDLRYNHVKKEYEPVVYDLHGHSETLTGKWNSTNTILAEQTMTVQLSEEEASFITENVTVLLSVAVEFGNVGLTDEPVQVKYAGCGKVIGVR